MNIYGYTKCPECNERNIMFRPLEGILPAWDFTECWNCKKSFQHSQEQKKVA